IADSHGIVSHLIHQFNFYFAAEHIIIRCTLGNIAAIEQQYMFMFFTELFQESRPTHKTAFVIIPVSFLIYRLNTAMHIASLQYYQFFSVLRIGRYDETEREAYQ